MPTSESETVTDDELDRADAQQQAIKYCHNAADAVQTGDLAHAQALLADANAAIDDVAVDTMTQTHRETGWDCYD
jgi:hypothetical protein